MKIAGSYEIKTQKEMVWKALNNPEILKKSIPGCEEFKKNSDTHFTATATNKIGPFNATFSGDIELKEIKPPDSYKIIAQGNSPVGFASGEALVKLEENNGITKLIYSAEVKVGGKIAQIGSRLIDMTAKKIADIFFKKFSQLVFPIEEKNENKNNLKINSEKNLISKKINKKVIFISLSLVVLLVIYLVK